MENNSNQRIILHPLIWVAIILISGIRYLVHFTGSDFHYILRKTTFFIFPHEILEPLRYSLVYQFSNTYLYELPVFSILFVIFMLLAIILYSKKGSLLPLQTGCYVFIISIVLSIPFIITGYFNALELYNTYTPSNNKGFLELVEGLTAPSKPSVILYMLQLLILLFYIAWAIYELKLINRQKKINRNSSAKPQMTG